MSRKQAKNRLARAWRRNMISSQVGDCLHTVPKKGDDRGGSICCTARLHFYFTTFLCCSSILKIWLPEAVSRHRNKQQPTCHEVEEEEEEEEEAVVWCRTPKRQGCAGSELAAYSRFDCQRLSRLTETSSKLQATRLRMRRRRQYDAGHQSAKAVRAQSLRKLL